MNPLFVQKNEVYTKIIQKYASKIEEQKKQVYDEAFLRLGKCLEKDQDVLFDATFSKKDMRERVYQVAIKNGVSNIYIVQIVCDEDVVKARLANRRSGDQVTTSNARQIKIFRLVKNEFDESQIQNDNPKDLHIKRIVYDTGSQEVIQFGDADEITRKIRKDVIDVLSSKYKN